MLMGMDFWQHLNTSRFHVTSKSQLYNTTLLMPCVPYPSNDLHWYYWTIAHKYLSIQSIYLLWYLNFATPFLLLTQLSLSSNVHINSFYSEEGTIEHIDNKKKKTKIILSSNFTSWTEKINWASWTLGFETNTHILSDPTLPGHIISSYSKFEVVSPDKKSKQLQVHTGSDVIKMVDWWRKKINWHHL